MSDEERLDSINLYNFIEERNGVLEASETRYAIDTNEHPQINHIIYHAGGSKYEMWDKEGKYFTFKALEYNLEKEQMLEENIKKLYKRNIPHK